MKINGVWLPIITPFYNDKIDYMSFDKMIDYYIQKGISGIIANATTGESPVISDYEFEELAIKTIEAVNGRIPVFYGISGNCTKKVTDQIKILEKINIQGFLSTSPYFNRPDQRGIYEHFRKLSETTSLPIVMYNIPYRTGRNMENETIFRLAELSNIVGIKDSCGNINQSIELLTTKPENFSVLTGEDIMYLTNLVHGGDGGILASAHIHTGEFINIYQLMHENKHKEAYNLWKHIANIIPLLFAEPNPAPLKYILHKNKAITSGELRLPLVEISESLKVRIDQYI